MTSSRRTRFFGAPAIDATALVTFASLVLLVSVMWTADARSHHRHRHHHRYRHHRSAYDRHGCNATATWDCRSLAVKHAFWESTGHPHGWKGHIVDHRRALVCGGTDTVSNMQWETAAEAKAKDRWETVGCRDGRRVGPPAPGHSA